MVGLTMHLIFVFFLSPLMWSQPLSFHQKVAPIAFLLILFMYWWVSQARKSERRLSLKSFYVISCWLTTVSDMLHDVVELHRMISDNFWGKKWEWSCLDSIEAHGMPQYDMLSRNLLTRLRQQKMALGGLSFTFLYSFWWLMMNCWSTFPFLFWIHEDAFVADDSMLILLHALCSMVGVDSISGCFAL